MRKIVGRLAEFFLVGLVMIAIITGSSPAAASWLKFQPQQTEGQGYWHTEPGSLTPTLKLDVGQSHTGPMCPLAALMPAPFTDQERSAFAAMTLQQPVNGGDCGFWCVLFAVAGAIGLIALIAYAAA